MGRSSKSDRKRRHNDDGVVEIRHSSTSLVDQNETKHSDGSRRKHRHHHHHRDSVDDRSGDDMEQHEVSRMESDRHRGRKNYEKKHRRDRSRTRQYSSDDNDSGMQKSSKKKYHRKHHSRRDDSDSERDSGKRKKRQRTDDGKRKKSKKETYKDVTAAFDTVGQAKLVDKSKLYSLGEQLGHPPDVLLDPESDYFAQNQRFRMYLYRDCGLTFDELSSKDARTKFNDFVQKFNMGDLEEGYYAPHFPIEALDECPSTRHQWSLKITHQDSQNLQMLQEGIRKQTEYQVNEEHHTSGAEVHKGHSSHQSNAPANHNSGESLVNEQYNNQNTRVMNRRLREHAQTTIEELTGGRKEGRERQIEKRQERAAKIHGASKYQQDMVELDDAALYGGNTEDDFRRLTAMSRQRAAAQEAKKEERILELQQKEKEKQNAMLQMLGLSHKIGQSKIQIQPRNDPPDNVLGGG